MSRHCSASLIVCCSPFNLTYATISRPKEFVHSAHSVIPDPKKSDDNDDSGLKGTSLALAIILPIFGIIIIVLVVIIILKKCKGYKSEDIEKLESLTALH